MKALALFVAFLLTSFSAVAADSDNSPKIGWTYINVEYLTGDVSNFENTLTAEDREMYLLEGAFQIKKRLFAYGGIRRAQLNFTQQGSITLLPVAPIVINSISDTHFEERDAFVGMGARFRVGVRQAVDLYVRGGLLINKQKCVAFQLRSDPAWPVS